MRPGSPVLSPGSSVEAAFERPFAEGWFDRPTAAVARDLLGRLLIHRIGGRLRLVRVVETEAYVSGDRANHACLGPTLRNRSMFGPPGTLYVYGLHQVYLANAVTRPGEAVLFRAGEPGPGAVGDTRGPGRLCRALGIGIERDRTSLVDGPVRVSAGSPPEGRIRRGVRVGITRDADRLLRFAIEGNRWVSSPLRTRRSADRRSA